MGISYPIASTPPRHLCRDATEDNNTTNPSRRMIELFSSSVVRTEGEASTGEKVMRLPTKTESLNADDPTDLYEKGIWRESCERNAQLSFVELCTGCTMVDIPRTTGGGWPSYILPRPNTKKPSTDDWEQGVRDFSTPTQLLPPHCPYCRGHWFPVLSYLVAMAARQRSQEPNQSPR